MTAFTEMRLWQRGLDLVEEIHRLSKRFPKEERFGMTAQIRDAAKSILANFAEGCGRYTYADKASKFVIARGECAEVLAFLYIAVRLNFLAHQDITRALVLQEDVSRMLSALIATCRKAH
jgi:four helix bundle protein